MRQVNPLHVLLLLTVFILFLLYQLQETQATFHDAKEQLAKTKDVAYQLNALKKEYANKEYVVRTITRLLHQSILKSATITKEQKSDAIVLHAKKLSKRQLQRVLTKILNSTYKIKALHIKRVDEKSVDVDVEVGW
ncbi:MAG TPA: hypothetical protein EYH11_01125 [Sulfurimonas autotrophica]|nr:hypothetical protein [Sulfurimonas autotrophica]